ncbi:superoxide dismutase family protein [Bdellovibrio sp. NC01]|uniref:superoxide dismutase family protein n=1 Tax=Bdellovibrio sp. NC01 TaxID=2220073 RepID=UPI001158CCE8|nr:superoxide dismutase family protein [Bdellovibrio sp. NC01]QDK36336.1 superoxide dismutase family protein [Bdellovibrio sp. NC01]
MKQFASAVLLTFALGACAQKPVEPVAPATPPPPPAPTKAQAVLKAAKGTKQKGMVHLTEATPGHMTVEVMVEGLKPGPHGFHIHEKGDCSGKDFSAAGGHFNPTGVKHGAPGTGSHAGDMGNIMVDRKGKATVTINVEGIDLGPGPNGIVGKSIIVHQGKDDLKSQPAGNSGPRVLCGVIEAM